MNKKTLLTILIPVILIILLIGGLYGYNYLQLQTKINEVIKADPRNEGIEVAPHFKWYINTSVVIYDLRSVPGTKSKADVFRLFLQFAEIMRSKKFDEIELGFRGKTKFKIKGTYFKQLGEEYSYQNPVYTMRTFPEYLMLPDGSRAYPKRSGGLLFVFAEQVEDFNDFHDKWFLDDMSK